MDQGGSIPGLLGMNFFGRLGRFVVIQLKECLVFSKGRIKKCGIEVSDRYFHIVFAGFIRIVHIDGEIGKITSAG